MARICIPDCRFAIAIFALALSSASAIQPESEAYRKAATLCDHGDWRTAEPFLRSALARYGAIDSNDVWEMRLLLGDTLTALTKYRSADDVLAPEPPPRLAKSGIAVRRLLEQAVLQYRLQKVPDSIRLLRKAEALARSHQPRLLADVFGRWAVIETAQHNYAAAERYARDSIRRARADHDRVLEINALGTLARLRTLQGHYDESVDLNRRALALANAAGTRSKIEKVSGNLGWTFILLGDFDAASDYLTSALTIAEAIGAEFDIVPWLHNLGDIALHNRDDAAALSYYQRGVVVARRISHRDLPEFIANTAVALLNLGDVAGARKANDEVRALLGDADTEQQLRSSMIDARIDARSGQLDSAITKMRRVIDAAATPSQRWEAHGRLAQFYAAANQPINADEEFRRAIDTAAAARRDVKSEELRLPFGALVREVHEQYVTFLLSAGKIDQALEAAELSRARTLEEALGEDADVQSSDPKRIAREHGAVILAYWLAPTRSYVWTITSTTVAVDVLKPSGEIERAVEWYARELTGPMAGSGSGPQGEQLFTMLLPAAAKRLRGGQRVIVIPDGRLHAFNMETLVDPVSHRYWIENVTLETANSLDLLERPRTEDATKSMLIVGDPPSPDRQYPRLAHAAEEVTRIQQQFPSCAVLTGASATPSAYARARPERFRFVHFVAHGVATRLRPLESAVILAREGESYKLYARDIIKKPLHASLVTISSCHGAGTRAYTGEGLVGLAWAFLHAGARQVIAALWEVNDNATPGLMSDLYAGIRQGDDPAVALRAAKLKLVRRKDAYHLPRYWAPFVIYSGS
ncbi:MAG TPA: CHAT domain-containing protein [Thermoanaerobaculia bacterium]|nr:CHAT domain-containing protein [Thermoanaerobaculia bacterium]